MRSVKSPRRMHVGAARQRADGSDNGARQVPGDDDGDAKCGERDHQHGATRRCGFIACAGHRALGQLEMTIADRGRQRNRPAQHGVGFLVILDEGFAFGGQDDHVVRGLTIRAQLGVKRSRELALVVGPEHAEEIGDRACPRPRAHVSAPASALVPGQDQAAPHRPRVRGRRPAARSRP